MKTFLMEEDSEEKKAYKSIVVDPKSIGILNNELSLRIIQDISKNPACALDIARNLKEHEQKIYYHLRKLETAGIISLLRNEKRFGMTAKIYDVVSPVVSVKLFEDGHVLKAPDHTPNPGILKFLHPFIENGELNANIVMGSPHPHGKHEATARDAVYVADFMLFLGRFVKNTDKLICKTDTEIKENELKENLIIFGSPKINTITAKINSNLPIYFDEGKNFRVISSITNKIYDYDTTAVIIKTKNPFNPKKQIILLAGIRSRAMRTATLSFINHIDGIMRGNNHNKNIVAKVAKGVDKTGDNVIDCVKFLE